MRRSTITAVVCALFLVAAVLFERTEHPHVWWESIPGFSAFLGLGGTWLLVLVGKSLLAARLERPRSYYDA